MRYALAYNEPNNVTKDRSATQRSRVQVTSVTTTSRISVQLEITRLVWQTNIQDGKSLQSASKQQKQLGSAEIDAQVASVVQELMVAVEKCQENADNSVVFFEERNVLQKRLGELYLKISSLPGSSQRQGFAPRNPFQTLLTPMAAMISE